LAAPRETISNASPSLSAAEACAAAKVPSEECAWALPTLLGFDPTHDHVAALTVRERATAGEGCNDDAGEGFDLATWKVVSSKKWPAKSHCDDRNRTVNEFAREIARRGLVPAQNLVTDFVVEVASSVMFGPVAILDAPLCGSMVEAKAVGRRFELSMIGPK